MADLCGAIPEKSRKIIAQQSSGALGLKRFLKDFKNSRSSDHLKTVFLQEFGGCNLMIIKDTMGYVSWTGLLFMFNLCLQCLLFMFNLCLQCLLFSL